MRMALGIEGYLAVLFIYTHYPRNTDGVITTIVPADRDFRVETSSLTKTRVHGISQSVSLAGFVAEI